MSDLFDIEFNDASGAPRTLAEFKGRVILIVNTASKCGFTPQYEGLEKLHARYAGEGLSVIGFPCNQFLNQEPGDAGEIASFCSTQYGVTFPVFEKIQVNGSGAHPLYRLLKKAAPGLLGSGAVKWNFTKFLIDREGRVVKRFAPAVPPEKLENDIKKLL